MAQDINKLGFKSIVENYDLFFIDIWGVIHNGINLHKNAVEVLKNLFELNKEFILLTNAPRPNATVNKFLEKKAEERKNENKAEGGVIGLKDKAVNMYRNRL